ncbi:MAG: DNA polymerase III subunit delta [Firmicutes bacterium]|nr:DNA polymerase III subunit delta [Bacillota bacterium]
MDFVQLKTSLRERIEPVYIMHGTDVFLVSKAVDLVRDFSQSADVTKFDETATPSAIMAACNTFSMFGDKRVVIVRGIMDATIREMAEYIKKPNPSCVLIMTQYTEKLTTKIQMTAVNCNPIAPDILQKLIIKQVADIGGTITPMAAATLAKYCNNNFSRINNEVIKLVAFLESETIEDTHVRELVSADEEFQIFELGNALSKRDMVTAKRIQEKLAATGAEGYAIFGSLVSTVRRLYYSLATTAPNDAVAAVLKCSPYAINYARRDNKHLAPRIARIYRFALDLEHKIKSGGVSVDSAITLLAMALVV